MKFRIAAGLAACAVTIAAFAAESAGPPPAPRSLTFADRVRAQEAIERRYYAHQIGASKTFEEAIPRSIIEAKVRRYLEESAALTMSWKTPITDAALQRELERMSGGTRMPERLQEVYAALGNDVFLIKECVARATLADRLTHNFYAYDPRFHSASRAAIDALRDQLASGALSPKDEHPNRTVSEIAVAPESDAAPGPSVDARVTQVDFDHKRAQLPSSIGQVSDVIESREAFSVRVVLSETATTVRVASYVVPKVAWDAWWSSARASFPADSVIAVASDRLRLPGLRKGATFDPAAPCTGDGWNNGILDDLPEGRAQHSAVWTGSVMIVWGGWKSLVYLDSGGRYDPVTDTWQPMTTVNAPRGRIDHTAVWTGSEMIVWGGRESFSSLWFVSGGRYDPVADTWTRTSLGPSARRYHTAVWTGSRMIIWGGYFDSSTQREYLNTGMLYDPSIDSWTPMATSGAPQGRYSHSAVWTGSQMIVWGGYVIWNGGQVTGDGGRYDPATDSWLPMAWANGRVGHSAVWTGTSMVVWGGYQFVACSGCYPSPGYVQPVNTGDRYDPVHDRWIGMSVAGAPFPMSYQLGAWTGHFLMVVANDGRRSDGGLYDPSIDRWTAIASDDSLTAGQGASLVWTGRHAIVWGGVASSAGAVSYLNSGRRYDPWGALWTPTSTGGPASQRTGHSAVWTGNEMIVWGGGDPSGAHSGYLDSGGRYDPATDSWTEMTPQSAPAPRSGQTTIWTGDEMIVWGGAGAPGPLNSGGRYNPLADVWSPISDVDAPSPRLYQAGAWTGRKLVVWGGANGLTPGPLRDGGVYDPATDLWRATTMVGAPLARQNHTAVWTGSHVVIWGGLTSSQNGEMTNTGGRYDPESDAWQTTSLIAAPSPRAYHTAIWAGDRMVVWGGGLGRFSVLNTGGRYDPASDTWSPTTTVGAPLARTQHAAVATTNGMLIWGGLTAGQPNTGGSYDLAHDRWTKIMRSGGGFPMPMTAVWTGEAMLVWDGIGGGRYFPGHSLDEDCDGDGVSAASGDCDDHDPSTYPGALERCDGVSNDCGLPGWPTPPSGPHGEPTEADGDRDGWLICAGDCDDNNLYVHPGAAEACDGWDTDCDGQDPALTEADADGDGYRICQGDCDDSRASVHPGAHEQCDGIDNDCDGEIDEGGDALCNNPSQPCYVNSCHGLEGCSLSAPDIPCDDGNPCTVDDTCYQGHCWGTASSGATCDDHNACTADDRCYVGGCYGATTALDGTACDDGDLCRTGKTCQDGYCGPGTLVACAEDDGNTCNGSEGCFYSIYDPIGCYTYNVPVCDDGNVCTDDSCDPASGCHHENNVAPCDDGNACTADDVCADGLCQAGVPIDGACLPWSSCNEGESCDDANSCTVADQCVNGICRGAPMDCDDHNACTGDFCAAGVCGHNANPANFCHDTSPCTLDACDPASGCTFTAAPEGAPCTDGNACTAGETCRGGLCTGAAPVNCDDHDVCTTDTCSLSVGCLHDSSPANLCHDANACTTDACDPILGCTFTPILDGQACEDGNLCSVGETCHGGVCGGSVARDCDDDSVCTIDSCNAGTGCIHTSIGCDDGNPCTQDLCDPVAGCVFPPGPTGTPCNDFYACTVDDRCDSTGYCAGRSVCDDGNPCTDDYADENQHCACSHVSTAEGTECNDANACTTLDACDGAGHCLSVIPLDCDDGDPCTLDSCSPASGCIHTPAAEGTSCDDGNACDGVESCDGYGSCVSHDPPQCDDHVPCTLDGCDPLTGCTYRYYPAGTSCADGNVCNGAEVCDGQGGCASPATLNCDDTNPCTDDRCDAASGCFHVNNTAPCSDGNSCTMGDVCGGGTCRAGAPVVCGAADQCHDAGVCNPATGTCSSPAKPDGTACDDASLCTTGETCQAGTCTPASSGLNEPNPRSSGYYKRLCIAPHSGDQLTNADAACVAAVAQAFAGISTVADLCAEILPSQPNSDPCDKTDDELMVLALNICRARVCTLQRIDSQCGSNDTVGQSLAESDAIQSSASRSADICAHSKCLDEEINTGRALEMNTLTLRREGSSVRLSWRVPYLEDGTGQPTRYHVWRRVAGSLAAFTKIGTTSLTSYLDSASGSGAFEYEVTAVMN
jgi:N-acetylneuraminic acid mutarotase